MALIGRILNLSAEAIDNKSSFPSEWSSEYSYTPSCVKLSQGRLLGAERIILRLLILVSKRIRLSAKAEGSCDLLSDRHAPSAHSTIANFLTIMMLDSANLNL